MKTIIYQSEAIAEAMDIGTLIPMVELQLNEENKLVKVTLVKDLTDEMHLINAFAREVNEKIKGEENGK